MRRCCHVRTVPLRHLQGGCRVDATALRTLATIPPTERVSSRPSARISDVYMGSRSTADEGASGPKSAGDAAADVRAKRPFAFAVKDTERGLFDHGVTPDARTFIAEAEEQYRASSAVLHQAPSMALPETETRLDPLSGRAVTVMRIAAPVGDTYIPSNKERFALRGHVGELEQQRHAPHYVIPNEVAQLSLKRERQMQELLAAPMPLVPKAHEVQWLLSDFYDQKLPLRPSTAEAVVQLFSQASLQTRLRGQSPSAVPTALEASQAPPSAPQLKRPQHGASAHRRRSKPRLSTGDQTEPDDAAGLTHTPAVSSGTPSSMDEVPFLAEMRRLYTHQKTVFAAPTSLTLELIMTSVSAVSTANKQAFHLANRLFLDADKYVVLPTRTMYTAFFMICQVNDAMPVAIARFVDAVTELQIPPNAPMVTALLKGLNEAGYAEEALALLSRTRHVPLSTPLLNASLEALLLSRQPLACFSMMEAVRAAALERSAETYTLLLLACEQSGDWSRVTSILADMQARRVKGNAQTLNLLLKGLLKEKLNSYALQLHSTMLAKQVEVWPALEEGLTRLQPCVPTRKR